MPKSSKDGADDVAPPFWVVHEFDEGGGGDAQEQDAYAGGQQSREYHVTLETMTDNDRTTIISNIQETKAYDGRRRSSWSQRRPAKVLSELFLPVGYPATVRDGYLEYQLYDSLQGLCSYLRSVLCSAAVLQAAGVGNANATALTAALTWASRDGLAMTGGLLYSYCTAHKFDAHVKEFRLFADIMNDVGFLLDMVAPWFADSHRNQLLLVSSTAVLCKTVCGISAGATKSSITQHFAVAGNMADLNAKESTQETMVSLIGMLLGIYAAKIVQGYDNDNENASSSTTTITAAASLNWTIFIVLTIIHVWANYKGVMLLRMRTLNRARAEIVLRPVVQHIVVVATAAAEVLQKDKQSTNYADDDDNKRMAALTRQLPEPRQVHESLLRSSLYILFARRLHLGVPLTAVLEQDCEALLSCDDDDDKYVLTVHCQTGHVLVSLLVGARNRDELKAYVHACAVLECMDDRNQVRNKEEWKEWRRDCISSTQRFVNDLFRNHEDHLIAELRRKGWDVDGRLYLGFSRRRSCYMKPSSTTTQESKKDK